MLELGWTRPELAAAEPADVEGLRWALYARGLQPLVARDFDQMITQVDRVDRPASKQTEKGERRRLIEDLRRAKRQQAEVRELLELDDEETPDGG